MKWVVSSLVILFASTAQSQVNVARASLDQVWVLDQMRFFYTTQGPHAVDATDANGNQVPDQVEDIATQTRAAWLLFIEGLDFPNPFLGERFRGVEHLDVHLISKEVLKSNGVAYDEIQHFKRKGDPDGTRSLCFNVATSIKAPVNLTPAHELFHIIQNGACFFKNRWYTEGTARWSEKALGLGGVSAGLKGRWPPTEELWQKLDTLAYDAAAQFWEPLALRYDPKGDLPLERIPSAVREMKYVNGEPVLKDLKLHGWEVIRDILDELGAADGQAAKERGLLRWSEEDQRSPKNTPHIRKVVEAVLARSK